MKTLIITILLLTFISGQEKIQTLMDLQYHTDKTMEVKQDQSLIKLQYSENHLELSGYLIGAGYGVMIYSDNKRDKMLGFGIAVIGVLWNTYNRIIIEKHKKELTVKTH